MSERNNDMTNNPSVSTNDAASLLESVSENRDKVRYALQHGSNDVTMVVLAAILPTFHRRTTIGFAVGVALIAWLGIPLIFRTRRLHNLGATIGAPTWMAMAFGFTGSLVSQLTLDGSARKAASAGVIFVALLTVAVAYRSALSYTVAGLVVVVGVTLAMDLHPVIFLPAMLAYAAVAMYVGRKQFFGPDAL